MVREHHAAYDPDDAPGCRDGDKAAASADAHRAGDAARRASTAEPAGPPLGVPVLAEVPELAEPLELFAQADRAAVQAVLALARLLEADQGDRAAATTGVGAEDWLAVTSALPRLERRSWVRTAHLLLRLPKLRGEVEAGRLSTGVRTWTHPRTGLVITSVPATWRPVRTDSEGGGGSDPPGGTDPPHSESEPLDGFYPPGSRSDPPTDGTDPPDNDVPL